MFILDKYICKQFAKYFTLVLCALVAIYFLVDFFERIDDFIGTGKTISLAFTYFLLKMPTMIDTIYPVCILLAGVITLGVLNHNQEFLSLKAAGISVGRICLPLLAAALVCTILALAMDEWVLPKTMAETNRIWYQEVKHQVPKGILRSGRIYHKGKKGIYSFIRPNPQANIFQQFSYSEINNAYKLTMHLTATEAIFKNGKWIFKKGRMKKNLSIGDKEIDTEGFQEMSLTLPEKPEDFFVPEYRIKEQSISQLYRMATDKETKTQETWFDLNNRLSFIMIGLPLILIGLPVLLLITQIWGNSLTLAIPLSCGIAFAMWGGWSTAQSMARAYSINPLISAWILHLLVGSLGLWLLKKQDA